MEEHGPLILVDGFCNLCNGLVRFIQKKDKQNRFRYLSLQSKPGKEMTVNYEIPDEIDSVVFIYRNQVFIKSDAVIEIARLLSYPWKVLEILKFLPEMWRDKLYDYVARNRYKWFGKKEVCNIYPSNDPNAIF